MDLGLTDRTALITGSSKGIGLAVAQWFAREGVHVCLVARSAELLAREAAAIETATGVTVRTLTADLADAAAREKVVAAFPDIDFSLGSDFTFCQEFYLGFGSAGPEERFVRNVFTHGAMVEVGYQRYQLGIGYASIWHNGNWDPGSRCLVRIYPTSNFRWRSALSSGTHRERSRMGHSKSRRGGFLFLPELGRR